MNFFPVFSANCSKASFPASKENVSINGYEAERNIRYIKKGGSTLIEQICDFEELSIEGLKGVGEPKAILPECAETHPIDTRIWRFATSIADTISMKLQ